MQWLGWQSINVTDVSKKNKFDEMGGNERVYDTYIHNEELRIYYGGKMDEEKCCKFVLNLSTGNNLNTHTYTDTLEW